MRWRREGERVGYALRTGDETRNMHIKAGQDRVRLGCGGLDCVFAHGVTARKDTREEELDELPRRFMMGWLTVCIVS